MLFGKIIVKMCSFHEDTGKLVKEGQFGNEKNRKPFLDISITSVVAIIMSKTLVDFPTGRLRGLNKFFCDNTVQGYI